MRHPSVHAAGNTLACMFNQGVVRGLRKQAPQKFELDLQALSDWQKQVIIKVQDPGFYQHNGMDVSTPGAGLTTVSQAIVKNSILKNFRPFSTPRTNYRPGTVFRVDKTDCLYFVEDVKSIKEYTSEEGTVTGRVVFTKSEMLSVLNVEINSDYIFLEVEIKDAVREYNEQTSLDRVLWENDKVETIVVDEASKYFIVREAILTKEITYRFSEENYTSFIAGKTEFKKAIPRGEMELDFPYYITKQFKEPRRVFYLKQEIGLDPYPSE